MISEARSLAAKVAEGVGELIQWLVSLDPGFAFLLALPFLVGLAGFLAEYLRQRRARPNSRRPGTNHGSL